MTRVVAGFCCLLLGMTVWAETFRYRYGKGDQYRILSTVQEDVYINDRFSHSAEILNRISAQVTAVRGDSGYLVCRFQTSEEAAAGTAVFSWGQAYDSEFWRDGLGKYTIENRFLMPIVRDVPVFPDRDLRPGDSWVAQGEEVHDFRAGFGLPEAFRFPITVNYRYRGKEVKDGRNLDLVDVEYTIFFRTDPKKYPNLVHPVMLNGVSRQEVYWDNEAGRPYYYSEEFDFLFTLSSGDTVEYVGTAEARVVEAPSMDRERVAEDVRRGLKDLRVPDAGVKVDDLGVTITLDNIQFPPDSSQLLPSEQAKLDRLGELLKKYPERDVLISGHTALAGTAEGRQQLSEDRAEAVGRYLVEQGVRARDSIITRGHGAEKPVADNATEEGRRANRRVEITIMEN